MRNERRFLAVEPIAEWERVKDAWSRTSLELRRDVLWKDVALLMYGYVPEEIFPPAQAPTDLQEAQEYWQQFAPTSQTLGPSFFQMKLGSPSPEKRLGRTGVHGL